MPTTNQLCHNCGNELFCSKGTSCWCNTFPKLLSPDVNSKCLCAACLEETMAKKINGLNRPITSDEKLQIKSLGEPLNPKKGIDYHIEEIANKKLLVMSKWYLLRRGHCCDNGCKNCPY